MAVSGRRHIWAYGLCDGQVTNYLDNVKIAYMSGTTEEYDYTGKKMDLDIGLVYFGARFYDPEVGRFVTQDPSKAGMNWYVYANDN